MTPPPFDRIKKAFEFKMGLLAPGGRTEEEESRKAWAWIEQQLRAEPGYSESLARQLMSPLLEIVEYGLTHSLRDPQADQQRLGRWSAFLKFLRSQDELPRMMIHRAADALERALHPTNGSEESSPMETPVEPGSASAGSPWKCLPITDELDKHAEYDARSATSPDGLRLIGARIRGKKHKHEGTNCDDWFDFVTSAPWTVIAVSDGAGSKKFSRVGARAACEAPFESSPPTFRTTSSSAA